MSIDIKLESALRSLGLFSENPRPTRLAAGNFNAIYEVRDGAKKFALRLNNVNDDPAVYDREDEYAAHGWAAEHNAAPQIFAATKDYLLMELLRFRHPTISDLRNTELLAKIVNVIKVVHAGPKLSINKSLLTRATYWFERRKEEGVLNEAAERAWEIVGTDIFTENLESEQVSGHGDLNPGNIALVDDRVLVLDFETAAMMAPNFDLSKLCYNGADDSVENVVLQMYYGDTNPKHKRQLLVALALQAFVGMVFGTSQDGAWSINNRARARFERYHAQLR